MTLEFRLAKILIRQHPDRTAAVLERIRIEDAIRVLSTAEAAEAALVVQRMSPFSSTTVLEQLSVNRVAEIMEALAVDACARLARRIGEERRALVTERLSARKVRALRTLLRFPENSAGALMDPDVMALAEDLDAREALQQIRQAPHNTHYNVYVVDRNHKLAGAMNLRELFLAPPKTRLADLMVRHPFRLSARANRSFVVAHPGWKAVHSLPVVDEQESYVGAVRYATLRALEEELFGRKKADTDTGNALGELLAVGGAGILDALTARYTQRGER